MRRLSLLVVVESAGAILVLPVARTAIGIATATGSETVMGGDLGMRGIDDRRFLGGNRRLRERHGVTGIVRRGIDGHRLGLGLDLGRVLHQRGGGGRWNELEGVGVFLK
jgi:hypothetical protein